MEVIDGQQRLTTLMLLLRAFYAKFGHMQDKASVATRQNIEKCIWKTDEFGEPDMSALKIDSEVATDKDKDEFLDILRTGTIKAGQKSRYAANFKFFQNCIDDFLGKIPDIFCVSPDADYEQLYSPSHRSRITGYCAAHFFNAERSWYALVGF